MSLDLTREQILALAPDASSAKSAQGLLSESNWPTLGADDEALWGECQGSGSKPYQVQVELPGLATRCSCPSRKFPCKHALALLLLKVGGSARMRDGARPEWVNAWLNSRREKSEKKAAAAAAPKALADSEQADAAAEKREVQRWGRIEKGLSDLERWMADQFRRGLAKFGPEQRQDWQAMAARMVDIQAPSLAPRLQAALAAISAGPEQLPSVMAQLGLVQLLVDAVRRRAALPLPQLADVRTALGWMPDKEAVLAHNDHVAAVWQVLGQQILELDGRLYERRVWLLAPAENYFALLQDFSHGQPRFEGAWLTGATYQVTLAFYPGTVRLRAIPTAAKRVYDAPQIARVDLDAALIAASGLLARNPWLWQTPMLLHDAVLAGSAADPRLQSGAQTLPLQCPESVYWLLQAFAGGQPLRWFGEWDGHRLRVLSAVTVSGDTWVLG